MDYGCKLVRERGLLVCKKDGGILGKIALEDLRAVVLLNGAVSLSGDVIAALAECDAILVHCKNFKPVGITIPNNRTYDTSVVLNQSAGNKNLNGAIWRRLLAAKIRNNAECLKQIGIKNADFFPWRNRKTACRTNRSAPESTGNTTFRCSENTARDAIRKTKIRKSTYC